MNKSDDNIEDIINNSMECYVVLNDIGVESSEVDISVKTVPKLGKRKNRSDDEWVPDSDEEKPLRKKAKKVKKPEKPSKNDSQLPNPKTRQLFYFPQDEKLR